MPERRQSIGPEEVRRLAVLARLRVAPGDEEAVAEALTRLVRFVDRMPEVGAAEAGSGGLASPTAGRPDVPAPCLDRAVVLANAPDSRDGMVRVPAVPGARRRERDG
jgi:aspartyl-tRNA(Asn)/glutamyl-tRNA(Gln) amidotransferase subunit C